MGDSIIIHTVFSVGMIHPKLDRWGGHPYNTYLI